MDDAGGVLVVQYTSAHAYRVFDLRHGSSARTLYETPDGQPSPEQAMAIRSLGAHGGWAALTVVVGQHIRIVLINLASGKPTIVRRIPPGVDMLSDSRVLADGAADSGLTITGGALYWAEIAQRQQHGRMYRYDIATGRLRVLDTAATSGPLTVAAGAVYWERGGRIGSCPRGALVPSGADWSAHPALLSAAGGAKVWQGRTGAIVLDLHTGAAARWSAADDRVGYASPTAIVLSTRAGFDVVDGTRLPSLGC